MLFKNIHACNKLPESQLLHCQCQTVITVVQPQCTMLDADVRNRSKSHADKNGQGRRRKTCIICGRLLWTAPYNRKIRPNSMQNSNIPTFLLYTPPVITTQVNALSK